MPFIHEQPEWPLLAWDSWALAGPLARVRHKQGRLLGRMEALGFELCAESSLAVLTSDVVKSSAIEGETLSADEVRSSIARRLGLDEGGSVRSGRDVEGVVEMMLDATRNFGAPLTKERLFAWHASLFPTATGGAHGQRQSTQPVARVGAWRTDEAGPMRVVSGQIGRERVHFEAPAAERVEGEMARFLGWFNGEWQSGRVAKWQRAEGEDREWQSGKVAKWQREEGQSQLAEQVDPVLKAGVAHFWFVTIHPFEDGNGRMARAIADLCLARADETEQRFYSMSSQIAAERAEYYRRLESAQRGGPAEPGGLDITLWLEWFLACLERAIDGAEGMLAGVLRKARVWERVNRGGGRGEGGTLNERQRLVINRLLDDFQGFLTTSKYAALVGCSADTALRDIKELVERGVLIANPGRGRSASYRLRE